MSPKWENRFVEFLSWLFIALFVAALVFCCQGCSTTRQVTKSEATSGDSTRVEVRTELRYVHDTVRVEIPAQQANRTTRDSTSTLENDYATSKAAILEDGSLYHDLQTKPQQVALPTLRPVETRDSIVYRDRWRTKTETEYVEVEKQATFWEKAQVWGFRIVFPLFALLLLWTFRTPIGRVIKRLRT